VLALEPSRLAISAKPFTAWEELHPCSSWWTCSGGASLFLSAPRAGWQLCVRIVHRCSRLPPGRASSRPRTAFLGPLDSVLREPGGFIVSQQWPRSRYVKRTLSCKALASRALIGMVRYERGGAGCSREQLLSTSIVSWPRTREHADGAGGQQGCSSPFHDLAALCSRGDRYATPAKRGKAPPKRVMAQTKLHFSHASSMSFPIVLCPHALLLPH
jgi:hypothetical protein